MATLINDVKTFKGVVGGVQQSIEFDTIKGIINTAETLYIVPVLGDEFYNELANYGGNDENVKGLIDRLRQASGYYTLGLATPQMVASFGDGGIAVNTQGNGQAVAKWMNVQLIESSMGLADKALENAIQYLEKYEKKKVDDEYVFKTWLDSDTYNTSKKLFISSATMLTEHFPVARGSRRVFLSMLEYIKRAEKTFILPLIGKGLFDSLKAKLISNTEELSNEEEYALELLRSALAHKAFSMGIPYLNFNADFQLISETDGVKNQDIATRDKLDGMKLDCDENAKAFSNKLKQYLDSVASSTVFPTYYNSPLYTTSVINKPYYRESIDPSLPFVAI